MKNILQIFQLTKAHHKRLYLAIFISLALTVLMIIPPYMTKLLFDRVYPNQDETLLAIVVIATALLSIIADLIAHLKDYFVSLFNLRLSLGTNFEFYRHISTMDISFFSQRKIGEISSRAKDALESVGGIMHIANTFIMNSISLVIFPPILLYINWKLALMALAVIPLDLLITWIVSRYTAIKTRQIADLNAEANARKIEFLSGMATIQALCIEQAMFAKIKDTTIASAYVKIRMFFWQKMASYAVHFLRALGVLLYTWYGWTRILSGELSIGTYLAFTAYSGYLVGPIKGLVGLVSRLQVLSVHVDRFIEIYVMEPAIRSPEAPIRKARFNGEIAFNSVSFGYASGQPILQDLDLHIEPGKTYGVVGTSGMGKTTLVQLIPRFYSPTHGAIQIDGLDIERLDLQGLRRQISYMQQDPFLFSGTLFDNIAIGMPRARQADIEAAARKACIHDFIASLQDGYATQVGERGNRLSQGQRQRLALARVLMRRAPIVILDEATSALDVETEHQVLETLQQELVHSTTILITHRLAALQAADTIVVLHAGRVKECGPYEDLMAGDTMFAGMLTRSTSAPQERPQVAAVAS